MALSQSKYAGIADGFAGFDQAKIAVVPVPFQSEPSETGGEGQGYAAILEAAAHMSLYDIETDMELYRQGIYLDKPLNPDAKGELMVETVKNRVVRLLEQDKFVTLLGGDQSVSMGSVRAYMAKYELLTVLHFSAHASLLDAYHDDPFHARCALREANEAANLVQVGIRSLEAEEVPTLKRPNVFFIHEMRKNLEWSDEAIGLMTRDVYISIHMSGFDPSLVPGVSRPVPGGLHWDETMRFFRKVNKKRNIVGFEVSGLLPQPYDNCSPSVAAKIHYQLLSYIFKKRTKLT